MPLLGLLLLLIFLLLTTVAHFESLPYKNNIPFLSGKNEISKNEISKNEISGKEISGNEIPYLFFVTPTVSKMTRLADMTRLSQTLCHVNKAKWIVVEDGDMLDPQIVDLLERKRKSFQLDSIYLTSKRFPNDECRGNGARTVGLQWVVENTFPPDPAKSKDMKNHGVVYFVDDDNTYDTEIFDDIRQTTTIGFMPAGFVTETQISTPIVNLKTGNMIGFYDGWINSRPWPVDTATFSISTDYMYQTNSTKDFWIYPPCEHPGLGETGFLQKFGAMDDNELQVFAANATRVLVWHTRTTKVNLGTHIGEFAKNTNLVELAKLGLTNQTVN